MGKAARLKRERAAGTRRQPDQDAPRPRVGKGPGEPRTRRRDRRQQGRYDFMLRNRGRSQRPSAAEWMENRTKVAHARNGRSRGASSFKLRRNDPRSWRDADGNMIEPQKGSRRAAFRARWMTGAIFRGRLTGKRYVDQDVVEERAGR